MKSLTILLIICSAVTTSVLAADEASSLPGKPADASEYSIGADSLKGEVLEIQGNEVSLSDSTSGETIRVKTDKLTVADLKPGDRVRVSFSEDDPKAAAQIIKENQK
jgi:hypothetical protein